MAIAVCKFLKFFRGSMLPVPLESFLVLKLLKIESAGKTTLEKVKKKIGAPFPEKILNTLLT